MSFTATTPLALIAVLVMMIMGPRRGLWTLGAALPLGAAAAFNLPAVGGASVTLADFIALAFVGLAFVSKDRFEAALSSMRPLSPGFFLISLLAFATIASIFFPRIFEGETFVFGIGRTGNEQGIVMRPLGPSPGNVTQLARLLLGGMVFFSAAVLFSRAPSLKPVLAAMIAASAVHVTLGVLDVLTYSVGRPELLDFVRNANYAMAFTQEMAGMKRMAGGFPEASAFGYLTLGLFGFWFQYYASGGRHSLAPALAIALGLALLLSASSSAYVAGGLFLVVSVLLNTRWRLRRRLEPRTAALLTLAAVLIPLAVSLAVFAYATMPGFAAYLDQLLFTKLESRSGVERMSWNGQALRNAVDTNLFGTGLGSVRASNFIVACLASLGLIGTALYAAFLASIGRLAVPGESETAAIVRGLKAACLALLLRALIVKATPNLELVFFLFAGAAFGIAAASRSPWPAKARFHLEKRRMEKSSILMSLKRPMKT